MTDDFIDDDDLDLQLRIAHEIALEAAYKPDDDPVEAAENWRRAEQLATWARAQLAAMSDAQVARAMPAAAPVLAPLATGTRPRITTGPRIGCLRARPR